MSDQERIAVSERILDAIITQVETQFARGLISRAVAIEFYESSADRLQRIAKSHRTLSEMEAQS